MLPLRDNIPSYRVPLVNYLLIAINAAAFVFELSQGRAIQGFLTTYGLVPAKLAAAGYWQKHGLLDGAFPFLSSMFLHGGWMHVISNMWMLYIFGDNVEDRLGHLRYLLFYLLAGLAAGFAQIWASWGSPVPMIGASGAISGVMGAYLVLYPRARVLTLVPIFVFLRVVELPAALFLGIWLWSQLYSGLGSLAGARGGGIAWWAHIGGFVGGIGLLGLLHGRRR